MPLSRAFSICKLGLQARFLAIVGTTAIVLSLAVWAVFNSIVEHMVERIGMRFAEKQVLYDKSRTLQPLIREIALARQLADVPIIKRWAANENDPALRKQALDELESRRRHFQDGSYFLALANSGHYYYNNASGEYSTSPMRYTLMSGKQADAWFFATLKSPESFHINIDPDISLGVTKVWINVLLRNGPQVLGVLGTGIDLTKFIDEVVDIPQPGVTSLFIDRNAAIQLFRRVDFIDFSSIAKSVDEQRSIDQLLVRASDRDWVRHAIRSISQNEAAIETRFVHVDGRRYLAAMASLPEVGWFSVTLLDLAILLPQQEFYAMGFAIGAAALGVLLILAFALQRRVIRPLASLTDATAKVRSGDFSPTDLQPTQDEVGHLTSHFIAMAGAVEKNRSALEDEIGKRIEELTDSKRILEVALRQEQESREAQSSLMAMLAHEIRNPVAVIGTAAQTMDLINEQPELKPRITKVMNAVYRIVQLLDTLLSGERLSAAGTALDLREDDLNTVCARLAVTLGDLYGRHIEFEAAVSDAYVTADWKLLGIAIGNLIDNAVKYSPFSGAIQLKVMRLSDQLFCIEVTDEGEGIALERQQQIFEKFTRGDHDSHIPGSGLGLYLVKFIARLHRGGVEVVSAPGAGSSFRILLPAHLPLSEAPLPGG
jgi:signal transduction histidine kinase